MLVLLFEFINCGDLNEEEKMKNMIFLPLNFPLKRHQSKELRRWVRAAQCAAGTRVVDPRASALTAVQVAVKGACGDKLQFFEAFYVFETENGDYLPLYYSLRRGKEMESGLNGSPFSLYLQELALAARPRQPSHLDPQREAEMEAAYPYKSKRSWGSDW